MHTWKVKRHPVPCYLNGHHEYSVNRPTWIFLLFLATRLDISIVGMRYDLGTIKRGFSIFEVQSNMRCMASCRDVKSSHVKTFTIVFVCLDMMVSIGSRPQRKRISHDIFPTNNVTGGRQITSTDSTSAIFFKSTHVLMFSLQHNTSMKG